MNQPSRVTFFDEKGTAIATLELSLEGSTVVHREWSTKPADWPINEAQVNQVVSHLMERIEQGAVTIGKRDFEWRVE